MLKCGSNGGMQYSGWLLHWLLATQGNTLEEQPDCWFVALCCSETVSLHLHRKGLVFKAPECGLKIDLLLDAVPTTMSPPLVCELCRLLRNYTPTTRDYRSIYLSMLCPCPFSQYIIYYYLLFAFLKLNSRTALQRRHFGSTIINFWRGVGFFVRFYNIIIIICLWLHHQWSEEFLEMILRFQFSLPKNREPTEGGGGLEHSRPGYLPFPHSFNHHFYPGQLRWWSLLSIFVLYLSMGRLCCLVWYALQVLCGLCGEARLSIYPWWCLVVLEGEGYIYGRLQVLWVIVAALS